ncbi:hypothetical protein D3C85_1372270 [compost metagenome]
MDKAIQQNNQVTQDRTLVQLSEARSTIDSVRTELMGEIRSVEKGCDELQGGVLSVKRLLSHLEAELREVEMEVWELQDIPMNMLISLGQGLRAAKESDNKSGVSRILKKMLEVVDNKLLQEGETIKERVLKLVLEDLDFAGSSDPTVIAKLKISLAKIPLEESKLEEA